MSLRVLVIDDDQGITQLMTAILQRLKHQPTIVNDPIQVEGLLGEPFDLIFLDLDMPGMDGIEVMRLLSGKGIDAALVLMSGFDDSVLNTAHDLAEAHHLNLLTHLSKPFNVEGVQTVLKQVDGSAKDVSNVPNASQKFQQIDERVLRSAIKRRQIEVFYQPQMDLKNQQIIGVEALCRLQREGGGLIMPDSFIPLAEQLGLIHDLTMVVASQVAADCEQLFAEYHDMTVSINVSTHDLEHLDFPEKLSAVFNSCKVDTSRVIVEVTETLLVNELNLGLDVLARMRLKGFKVSIDDFGTGVSTLEHIKHFPATELKIDKSFVQSLEQQDKSKVLVEHTIGMAKQLGLDVVAEGIESEEAAQWLLKRGCDIGQGYWLSKPIPTADLLLFLQKYSCQVESDSIFSVNDDENNSHELLPKNQEAMVDSNNSQTEVLLLNAILPISGRFRFIGASMQYGIKAALEEYADNRGEHDFTLQLELFDDRSDIQHYRQLVRNHLSKASVACFGGVFSLGHVKEFISAIESSSQPIIGPFSGSVLLRNMEWRNVFNVRPGYENELNAIIEKVRNRAGNKVFVYPDNAFGKRALAIIEQQLPGLDTITYSSDRRSHAMLVDSIQQSGAAHILFIGGAKTLTEIIQSTSLPESRFYTISLVGLGSLLQLNKSCSGRVSVTVPMEDYQASGSAATSFRKHIEPLLDSEDRRYMNSISFEAYVNAKVLITALQRTQDHSPSGVTRSLELLAGVDIGLDCPVTWDANKRQFLHQVSILEDIFC